MVDVEIYTSPFCPFCYRAKALLDEKGIPYREIDVMMGPGKRREMRERSGGDHRVPQVFIDGEHVGGCDELYALEDAGALDVKLGLGVSVSIKDG